MNNLEFFTTATKKKNRTVLAQLPLGTAAAFPSCYCKHFLLDWECEACAFEEDLSSGSKYF